MDIVEMAVSLILFGSIGVTGIGFILTANTTGWAPSAVLMLDLVPVFAVIGLIYTFIPRGKGGSG